MSDFSVERTNLQLLSCQCKKNFLIIYLFCNWLFVHHPINTATAICFKPAFHFNSVVSANLEQFGFRVVAINIANCSLGGPVLDSSCTWAKIKTSCFFFRKHASEQFVMPPKKKLMADRRTVDVERGFSTQNLICMSQRCRLTTENHDMLLRVQMEATREGKGQSE